MTEEKVHLTWPPWHTYIDHLKELLHQMKTDDAFTDVTLVSDDGRKIRAHKVVIGACSPTMKTLLTKKDTNIIDLKGIAFEEIDSILQFIYLGEATLYEERMQEFLCVAQKLEIKELFKAETKCDMNYEAETQSSLTNCIPSKNEGNDSCHKKANHEVVKYRCNQCDKQFTRQWTLTNHIQSAHEGVKYACNQCDHEATAKHSLMVHVQSVHEGIKYACNYCEQQFSQQGNLKRHIQAVHEVVGYP